MGIIRNQSIKSTFVTYIGFGIGGLTTLLVAKLVDPNILGLTRFFTSIAAIVFAVSNLGSVTMMNRFYPYYRDMLPPARRDIFGLVIMLCTIGFLLATLGTFLLHDLVVRKYGGKSIYVVHYYYLLLPFSFFYLFFTAFENFSYNQYKSIFPIFLKEVAMRILTLVLAVLLIVGVLNLPSYIWSYSFIWGVLLLALIIYLYRQKDLVFSFSISKVTKRLARQMVTFNGMLYAGAIFAVIAGNIDNLAISSIKGLDYGFVFEFATYICTIILIPQRSIIAISIPVLAKSWKDRNIASIQSIYKRSSNTMFTYAMLIYMLIILNAEALFRIMELPQIYYECLPVIRILGVMRIVEMYAGVNSPILGTSNHWRVDFFSSVAQFCVTIPLNIWFLKLWGLEGSAVANVLSVLVFNSIRMGFLYRRFGLNPFSVQQLHVLLTALTAFLVCYYLPIGNYYLSILVKTVVFSGMFVGAVLYFNLSQDVTEAAEMVMKRLRRK